ncbi:MAG: hypothetical protein DDT21_02751 [Syntrophomonadaceae bacterium]|nr:hypothetical protein [Bacillota bacterium]
MRDSHARSCKKRCGINSISHSINSSKYHAARQGDGNLVACPDIAD